MKIKGLIAFHGCGKIIMQYNPDINGFIVYTNWIHEKSARVMIGNLDAVGIWKPKIINHAPNNI